MRGFPTFTMPQGDRIEIEISVPSGQPGVRHYGERVLVRIDRELNLAVVNPVFERVVLEGGVNCGIASWFNLPEHEAEWELCRTALDIIDAQVEATLKLFRRGYLDPRWLSARARIEVMS